VFTTEIHSIMQTETQYEKFIVNAMAQILCTYIFWRHTALTHTIYEDKQ